MWPPTYQKWLFKFVRVANHAQPPNTLTHHSLGPTCLSPSLFSFFFQSLTLPLHVEEGQPWATVCLKPRLEKMNGGALTGHRRPHLSPWYLAISSVVWPLFLVRPPVFGTSIQRSTKLCPPCRSNRRRGEADYYSHHAFYDFFWWTWVIFEVRPPKTWCTLHKLLFGIYICYVLRTFENHTLRHWIVSLSFVSICV